MVPNILYPDYWGELFKEIKKEEDKQMTFEEWYQFNKPFISGTKNIIVIVNGKSKCKFPSKIPLFDTVMTVDACRELFSDLKIENFGIYVNPFDENDNDFGVELLNVKNEENKENEEEN